ncbi:glycosyltransferase [Formicincola oecophyllae]|uniref:Glycosyltransferase n=1 Tax=Formicincola oecophyllae TaxID=2558361 RepID=A0A4Y6UDE2_9PROT|nr:glycosyltransferase [Formicincola oecophyllae]
MLGLGALSGLAWLWLWAGNGRFWQPGPFLRQGSAAPGEGPWPAVAIVVPARNEAAAIQPALTSLLGQDYPGWLRVFLVDDESTDGTSQLAAQVPDPHKRLTIIKGNPHAPGWSGKLWAVHQGEGAALAALRSQQAREAGAGGAGTAPGSFIMLTDADITHAPDHVTSLVRQARDGSQDMVSEMVSLNCTGFWEKALIPAFVYFFAMIYPYRKVADPRSRVAGAAGGTVLVSQRALVGVGGIQALRGALIDDCTLAKHVQQRGGRLYLGSSRQAWSIRSYQEPGEIWHMIVRTAYNQLRYSPLRLAGALVGLVLVWFVPPALALKGRGAARWLGAGVCAMAAASYLPTLRHFKLGAWRVLTLPLIVAFYMLATVDSAIKHHFGAGVTWHGRAYGGAEGDSAPSQPAPAPTPTEDSAP